MISLRVLYKHEEMRIIIIGNSEEGGGGGGGGGWFLKAKFFKGKLEPKLELPKQGKVGWFNLKTLCRCRVSRDIYIS